MSEHFWPRGIAIDSAACGLIVSFAGLRIVLSMKRISGHVVSYLRSMTNESNLSRFDRYQENQIARGNSVVKVWRVAASQIQRSAPFPRAGDVSLCGRSLLFRCRPLAAKETKSVDALRI